MTKYYFNKTVDVPFDKAIELVTEELKKEGFGILTEIDVQATLKKKTGCGLPSISNFGSLQPAFCAQSALSGIPYWDLPPM